MPTTQYHLGELLGNLFETTSERLQAVAAASAITLPWWLPDLHSISAEAALIAPILGCIWFVVQIALRIIEFERKMKK